jgi:hypothetical protein
VLLDLVSKKEDIIFGCEKRRSQAKYCMAQTVIKKVQEDRVPKTIRVSGGRRTGGYAENDSSPQRKKDERIGIQS